MTQYSGKIIRKNPVTPTQQSASGVWTTADAAAAVKNNNWPVAGVPNPISRSVRTRASAGGYFGRTPSSASSRTTWTWSGWVKRGALSTSSVGGVFGIFGGGTLGTSQSNFVCYFNSNYDIYLQETVNNVSNQLIYETTSFYRDPSAWYHIVIAMDTTQATAANRTKIYVNGVQAPGAFSVTPGQNQALSINNTVPQYIGGASVNPQAYGNVLGYFDGYITEVNFIDGQQLTPSSFGTTNSITGAWVPMPYTGTYGTNGYYLNFKDNTSTTTLGYDYSGNSNNWTANNISLTAGVTYDSMVDVPTLWMPYNTAGDTGALVRGNYAVLNPVVPTGAAVISGGNLNIVSTATYCNGLSTINLDSGAYYCECVVTTHSAEGWGVWDITKTAAINTGAGTSSGFYGIYSGGATLITAGIGGTTNAAGTPANGDIIQVAWSNGNVWLGKNNTWYNSTFGTTGNPSTGANPTFTGLTVGQFAFIFGAGNATVSLSANFGQRPFTYTPPTGFKTLNTFNLPAPTINNGASYMAATLWTGNGTTQSITNTVNGVSFQPDFVWIKDRSSARSHILTDAVRGTTQQLYSNETTAEATDSNRLTAFNSNGFNVGTGLGVNASTETFVGWQWNAGGSTVTNTSGSISSQVRASTTAAFSVVTYTGTGANATVGHGLGVAPKMIIARRRDNVVNWYCYHSALTAGNILLLNSTQTQTSVPTAFNSGTPTSTTFPLGADTTTNASGGLQVAYCFAEVAGFSKIGAWQNNNSNDGTFVYLGFRPRFVLLKSYDAAEQWFIQDSSRQTYNYGPGTSNYLVPSSAVTEGTNSAQNAAIDFLSNGFKIRSTNTAAGEISFGTRNYIYMAFAENPFKYSNAR